MPAPLCLEEVPPLLNLEPIRALRQGPEEGAVAGARLDDPAARQKVLNDRAGQGAGGVDTVIAIAGEHRGALLHAKLRRRQHLAIEVVVTCRADGREGPPCDGSIPRFPSQQANIALNDENIQLLKFSSQALLKFAQVFA